jgi:peptidoglycan/LPS O-acetylase OafA/YrhL
VPWKNHLRRITSDGSYIPEIEGLRFVAILAVVLLHVHTHVFRYSGIAMAGWIDVLFGQGGRGVPLFFVLSGFLLSLPFAGARFGQRPPVSLKRYYARRLTRLEPPYFFNMLLLYVLLLAFGYGTKHDLWPHLLASLFYSHVPIYGAWSKINPVSWSLEIEVQFYLLVPLLTAVFALRSMLQRRIVLLAVAVGFAALHTFVFADPRLTLSLPGNLAYFAMGFFLTDLYLCSWQPRPRPHWAWDVVSLVGWPALFLLTGQAIEFALPFLTFALCVATFRGQLFRRLLTVDWITIIGGMCYTIYLFHYQVIAAAFFVTRRLVPDTGPGGYLAVQLVLLLPCVLVASALWFVLIERPCMKRDWPRRLWAYSFHRRAPSAAQG